MKAKFLVPLLLFFGLAGFLAFGLTLNPREVPSPLIDKPAPDFSLARLDQPEQTFALKEMKGQVWLLNVWASWCASCRDEHPVLVELANHADIVEREGREAGDRSLVVAASRLSAVVRDVDTVCRIADTRFAILVEGPQQADHLKQLGHSLQKLLKVRSLSHINLIFNSMK